MAQDLIEYDYEYRDAEYDGDWMAKPEQIAAGRVARARVIN
ncbi:MAG: hypothetical protein ACO1RT_11825 [Planctomycetaceae bacterium]